MRFTEIGRTEKHFRTLLYTPCGLRRPFREVFAVYRHKNHKIYTTKKYYALGILKAKKTNELSRDREGTGKRGVGERGRGEGGKAGRGGRGEGGGEPPRNFSDWKFFPTLYMHSLSKSMSDCIHSIDKI
jgi:hypothetical protein